MPCFSRKLGVFAATACFLAASTASAHVSFLTETGLVLMPGETVTLEWVDTIPHDTQGYNLDFYLDVDAEPESIASGLAPDVHTYDWVVPDVVCSACQLRVVQDNSGADYEGFITLQIGEPMQGSGGATGTDTTTVTTTDGGGESGVGTTVTTTTVGGDLVNSASVGGPSATNGVSSTVSGSTGPSSTSTSTTGMIAAGGSMGEETTGEPFDTSGARTDPANGCTLTSDAPDTRAWPLVALLGLGVLGIVERRRR